MLARLLLIIVASVAAGCSGLLGDSRPAPVETAEAVIRHLDEIGAVWPGYWSHQEAFLIYEPDGEAILYTTAPPPEGWDSNSAATGFYSYKGTLPGLTGMFRTGYAVGDVTATAVPQEKNVSGTLITLFHEAFHTFQEEQFYDHENGFEYVEDLAVTPELAADAEVERRLLSAALAATDLDEVRQLARTYLAVRNDRLRRLPERARHIEARVERIEGSAELVGYQAAAAALDRPPERVAGAIRQLLETPLRKYPGDIRQRAYRWRLYATGAAIGLLLDRMGPGDWRKRMEAGATFGALLAEAVGSVPREESTLAHLARERFGYDELVKEIERLWGSFEVASADDFYRSARARVVISFASPALLKEAEAFFRGDFYLVGEKLTWIEADIYTAELDGFSLAVRNRDVLQDGVRGRLTVAVPELPSHPQAEGAADVRLPGIELRGSGITLTVERPVELTASGNSLHISVLVAP